MKKLVIVESPTKAKNLTNILDPNIYTITATYGHVCQLKQNINSVKYINNDFTFDWVNKNKYISVIQKLAKNKEEIILATDLDREGEAIAFHVNRLIQITDQRVSRIIFNEISKKAIYAALENKMNIREGLVNSYLARMVLDFKMGFIVSPLLWKFLYYLGNNQSAGRVQSAALKLFFLKEKEIVNFKPKNFYKLNLLLDNKAIGQLHAIKDQKIQHFNSEEEAKSYKIPKTFKIIEIKKTIKAFQPPEAYNTPTMQRDITSKLHLPLNQLMQMVQELYEGININNTTISLITYIRTDSTKIDPDKIREIHQFIKNKKQSINTKIKNATIHQNAQNAHLAITPVDIHNTPKKLKNFLSPVQLKIYKLIWRRAIASQSMPAKQLQLTYYLQAGDTIIKYHDHKYLELGFLYWQKKYRILLQTQASKVFLEIGDKLSVMEEQCLKITTKAPGRYSEGSFIKEISGLGIGRPSTYPYILNILKKREYIFLHNRAFYCSRKGEIVFYFLESFFQQYTNYQFTSDIEKDLFLIAENQIDYKEKLLEWIEILENNTKKVEDHYQIFEQITEKYKYYNPIQLCDKCSGEMYLKCSKYGPFLFCEPCNYFKSINEQSIVIEDFILKKTYKYNILLHGDKSIFLPAKINFALNVKNLQLITKMPLTLYTIQEEPVILAISKFGFYLKYKDKFKSINLDKLAQLNQDNIIKFINSKRIFKKPSKNINKNNKNNKELNSKDH